MMNVKKPSNQRQPKARGFCPVLCKKVGFKRKPHSFFLNDGFSETLTRNLGFHVFWGFRN